MKAKAKAKATAQPVSFRDEGHLQYYFSRCVAALQTNNLKNDKKLKASNKKAVKLLKSLSKDLPLLSSHDDSISEAARVLMTRLEQLETEEKELKKKRKAEKAKIKASRMRKMVDSESSSSSSESSDSDCEELVDMSRFRNNSVTVTVAKPLPVQLQEPTPTQATSISHDSNFTAVVNGFTNNDLAASQVKASCVGVGVGEPTRSTTGCSKVASGSSVISGLSVTQGTSARRIEVCMGNKCKKSGGEALLQEFAKVVDGVQGGAIDVVGCKCMGKCRDGPNVRVCNSVGKGLDDSVRIPANPLCIGVGLEDVGAIVTNFLAEDGNNLGLVPAS